MRIKTPRTLVTFPRNEGVVVYNYVTRDATTCASEDIYWFTIAPDWTELETVITNHPDLDPESIRQEISRLVDCGMLLEEGTPKAKLDQQYAKSWELGPAVALFHFSNLDNEFADNVTSAKKQRQRALTDPSPKLFWKNNNDAIHLPPCDKMESNHILEIMKRRRTRRNVLPESISLQQLSECLYAGVGITGFVQSETAVLPLKMTPSGGARNPYEAYILVRDVLGLEAGVYHYSAIEHSIKFISALPEKAPKTFVQNQDWADEMPAIIFLVAVLERVTWKYSDPNAYRVVMIEAGHIAQNMMLACTNNELTACPTAALNHSEISEVLGLSAITQTPVYALLIGKPGESLERVYSVQSAAEQGLIPGY